MKVSRGMSEGHVGRNYGTCGWTKDQLPVLYMRNDALFNLQRTPTVQRGENMVVIYSLYGGGGGGGSNTPLLMCCEAFYYFIFLHKLMPCYIFN